MASILGFWVGPFGLCKKEKGRRKIRGGVICYECTPADSQKPVIQDERGSGPMTVAAFPWLSAPRELLVLSQLL
jgi:hypothetical protein